MSIHTERKVYVAIEGGGTKFLIAFFNELGQKLTSLTIPTRDPQQTLGDCVALIHQHKARFGPVAGLGIAHFGPLNVLPGSADYGKLRETPKVGWSHFDVLGYFRDKLGEDLPMIIDTDVNGAVLAEARWGAGVGIKNLLYLTIGTGIGGGALVNGKVLYGYAHTEMGHIALPRLAGDDFVGTCPAHGACFEGLASGFAMMARWGFPAEDLPEDHPSWAIEASYIAKALRTYAYTLAPDRIILGGGVMDKRFLFGMIRDAFRDEMADYGLPKGALDSYIVPSGFAGDAGLYGALGLIMDNGL